MSNHDRNSVPVERKLREARPWITAIPPIFLIALAFVVVSLYARAPSELASARIAPAPEPARDADKARLHSTRPSQKP
jgi:hypothetical protein